MPPEMEAFLRHLDTSGHAGSVPVYRTALKQFAAYVDDTGGNFMEATTGMIQDFQRFLSEGARKANGAPLARATQLTRIAALKAFYRFLVRRGDLVANPAGKIKLPRLHRRQGVRDHLSQQEAIALVETQANILRDEERGTRRWALAYRDLCLLGLALATGRRKAGLRAMKVEHLDFRRNEIRVEREKGKAGRVLPAAAWAMGVAHGYVRQARPILLRDVRDEGWLFVGERKPLVNAEPFRRLLPRLRQRTAEANPDLEELPGKRLTAHGLRVTFATMMFLNGAGIRVVNELLLHARLSTTAQYTPLPLEDLRRACRLAHPRA